MNATLLRSEEITSILLARGCTTENDQIRLLPDEGSAGRRGWVSSGIWFRIGHGLDRLADRAREFYQACPEIAARPLFFFEECGWQWFGCGDEICSDELREDQLTHAVSMMEAAFAATDKRSTTDAAEGEIDAFLDELCRLPDFSMLDRELLTRYVGNELKARLVGCNPHTRWAHGNLTAQAIRMGKSGQVRLLEPEFASRTHFFAEDRLRLDRSFEVQPVLRAYSWLRQILIDPKSVRPNLARALRILDASGRAVRQSLVAQIAGEMGPPTEAPANVCSKLYASQTDAFTEDSAVTIELPRSGWQRARFVLALAAGSFNFRLDPAMEPGLTEIGRISVRSSGMELFSCDQPGRVLSVSGTCFPLKSESSLLLLSYGNDPQVRLPRVAVESGGEMTVEVWMQWRSLESAFNEYGPALASTCASGGTSVT